MKILYSCLSQSWGGLEMRTIQGAEQLLKRNIETDILAYPGSRISIEAERRGIITHHLKVYSYFHPLRIFELSGIIRQNSYSIIHTQFSKDLWVIVPALKLIKTEIPLLLTKRVGSSVSKKDFLHKKLYSAVKYVIAISNEIRQNVIETCPVPEEKVKLIFNGVDLEKFNPAKVNPLKIRKDFNIEDNIILIGMAGRFTYGKGHETFLTAARELLKKYSGIKFLIAGEASRGEDAYLNKIKSLADENGISDKIIYTGFRDDIPEVLSALDIFVFPSHSEAFGNALIEAMAMGRASVSSNSAGVLDIVVDGKTGYLFQNRNGGDLAEKISMLIESPRQREAFGNEARKHTAENFDLNTVTDKLVNLYNSLLH
jgi:glycosyltransferase involved in cell wall biosynthesis